MRSAVGVHSEDKNAQECVRVAATGACADACVGPLIVCLSCVSGDHGDRARGGGLILLW